MTVDVERDDDRGTQSVCQRCGTGQPAQARYCIRCGNRVLSPVHLLRRHDDSAQIDALVLAIASGAKTADTLQLGLEAAIAATDADGAVVHLLSDGSIVLRGKLGRDGSATLEHTYEAPRAGGAIEHLLKTGEALIVDEVGPRPVLTQDALSSGMRSSVHVPVRLREQLIGTLRVEWQEAISATSARISRLHQIAAHLAVAIMHLRQREEIERLLDEARQARAEMEAIFDAAQDAILILDKDGHRRHANQRAREPLAASDESGTSLESVLTRGGADESQQPGIWDSLVERALRGEGATDMLTLDVGSAGQRHIHVQATPVRGAEGVVDGVVVIGRDFTELLTATTERARLDGAVKIARSVAHQLNNQLSPIVGYGEVLVEMLDGEAASLAQGMLRGAVASAETIGHLQRVIRFEDLSDSDSPRLDVAISMGIPALAHHSTRP